MGFVCTAGEPGKSEIALIGDSVLIPIGYDDVETKSYSLLISFDITGGGIDEFFFCVIEASHQDGTEVRYWSGLEVGKFTSREDRILIRQLLLEGTKRLLNHKAPKRVFCCTHDSDLPEKALEKHLLIAQIFKMCGYEVRAEPDASENTPGGWNGQKNLRASYEPEGRN